MAEPEGVTHLPRALPREVEIDRGMVMTPNEMRLVRELSGSTLTAMMGGGDGDLEAAPDQVQALIYVMLRREGYDATWEQAGDVMPRYSEVPQPRDPTSGGG